MKRQPRSATTLKKWRGEESPSVLRRRGCQREVDYIDVILGLKDRIKKLESENSTLEEQIELMGGY